LNLQRSRDVVQGSPALRWPDPEGFRDWVVELEDGLILDVGPCSRAASGSDAGDVVDLGDVTLLPVLVDAHQHLVFDASHDPMALPCSPTVPPWYAPGHEWLCSSDAGVGPNKPHDVLPQGVVGLLRIGMTNAQALTATTAVAAQVCGIADTTGTLEPGKDADLVAVRGNPVEDINAIHNVAAVFVRGTQV
jgi:imidazolonepropionase-like amidohydrolase